MIDPALFPLVEAAAIDGRLRPIEVRVLVLACRELNSATFLPFKLDVLLLALRTRRGQVISRGNASRARRQLEAIGYLMPGPRQGVGGARTWRLPTIPEAIRAKFPGFGPKPARSKLCSIATKSAEVVQYSNLSA